MMEIIPVIDLLDSKVVHAKRGERHRYQPIESSLTNSSEPDAIIDAYFRLFPFKNIYIADLNAIQGNGHHLNYLKSLIVRFPECKFWIDAGISRLDDLIELNSTNNIRLIIGTENNPSTNLIESLNSNNTDWILSLDFISEQIEFNTNMLEFSNYWPNDIIAMMLSRVGTLNGIDNAQPQQLEPYIKKHHFYAAGGISNENDLLTLSKQGYYGALIATALHNGRLGVEQLRTIEQL